MQRSNVSRRHTSNSSEASGEVESWNNTSIDEVPFPTPFRHSHHHHHHHHHLPAHQHHSHQYHHCRTPQPQPPPQPPPSSSPILPVMPQRISDSHHHHHHLKRSHRRKPEDNNAVDKIHLSPGKQYPGPINTTKMLGIDIYETENLVIDINGQTNFPSKSKSRQPTDLPLFHHRCIHAMADIITSPYTILPTLFGVFFREGGTERRSFNKQLSAYLKAAYKRQERTLNELQQRRYDILVSLLPSIAASLASYTCGLIFGWQLGLSIGLTSVTLHLIFTGVAFYGGLVKRWKIAQQISETLLRYAKSWRLVLDILFYQPPKQASIPTNVRLLPVSIKLGSSESAWDTAIRLSEKMWEAATSKYSKTVLYLQYASDDVCGQPKRRCRKTCCLPAWVCLILWIVTLLIWTTALSIYIGLKKTNTTEHNIGLKITLITSGAMGVVSLLALMAMLVKPSFRLLKMQSRFRSLKKERLRLQEENRQVSSGALKSVVPFLEGKDKRERDDDWARGHPSRENTSQQLLISEDSARLEEGLLDVLDMRLRREDMETCHTLHLLDSRCNRQTRFFISIDATACRCGKRVAELCQLINKIMISSIKGRTGVYWHLTDPREMDKSDEGLTSMALAGIEPCVPNVFVLLMCKQEIETHFDPTIESEPINPTSQTIHDTCHLTLYIDEPPLGPQLGATDSNPDSEVTLHRLARTSNCSDAKRPFDLSIGTFALPEVFISDHPLADINAKKFQSLLACMSFLGRMLKTDERAGLRLPLLEASVTWLCLLRHWPFHTAWLSLFLEEHYSCSNSTPVPRTSGREGGSSSEEYEEDAKSTLSIPVLPSDTLSMLYSRVLERLGPALLACRQRGQSVSALPTGIGVVTSTTNTQSHQSLTQPPPTANSNYGGAALRLCHLAARDHSPARLADFLLHMAPPKTPESAARGCTSATDVTVRDLTVVMSCSPLLNPKIRGLIQAFLNRRGFPLVRSISKDLHVHQSLQSLRNVEHDFQAVKARPCPIRLKNGLPQKPLSKMTVDDICNLVTNMEDLGIPRFRHRSVSLSSSDTLEGRQISPQSISAPPSIATYLARLHALNISGPVLTVCMLNDSLRQEIGMSFGDWQLFSSLINHLKYLEGVPLIHATPRCQCFRSIGDIASVQQKHWHNQHHLPIKMRKPIVICKTSTGLWASETILNARTQEWCHTGESSSINGVVDGEESSCGSSGSSVSSATYRYKSSQLKSIHAQNSMDEETCRLSVSSCSIYSADLSCGSPTPSSSSVSSVPSSFVYVGGSQEMRTMKQRYGVNV